MLLASDNVFSRNDSINYFCLPSVSHEAPTNRSPGTVQCLTQLGTHSWIGRLLETHSLVPKVQEHSALTVVVRLSAVDATVRKPSANKYKYLHTCIRQRHRLACSCQACTYTYRSTTPFKYIDCWNRNISTIQLFQHALDDLVHQGFYGTETLLTVLFSFAGEIRYGWTMDISISQQVSCSTATREGFTAGRSSLRGFDRKPAREQMLVTSLRSTD